MRLPSTVGIAGWVQQHREALIVDDTGQDARFDNRVDVVWGATNYDNAGNATVGVRNTNSGGTNLNFLQWHYQTAGSTPPAGYGNPVTNGTVIRVSLQPIPEPSTVALFGAGAAALAAWTLRRRRVRRR